MSFRLSTLLLGVVVVAMAIGWFTDRTGIQKQLELERANQQQKIDKCHRGVYESTIAYRSIIFARSFQKKSSEKEFESNLLRGLVFAIIDLRQNEAAIAFVDGDERPTTLGHEALKLLDCSSADDFFEFAIRICGYDDQEFVNSFPEIYDRESKEYKSLRQFIVRSLDSKHPIEWGW